jgi:starch synthase
MKIVHIGAECYPVAKVGGLADVVGALPKYQNDAGFPSEVIMPFYDNKFTKDNEFSVLFTSKLKLGKQEYKYQIKTLVNNTIGFDLFLVDIPELIFKDYVYSFDDTDRFLAFQIAALNWMLTWETKPTTVHCHDHHTGLVPFMMTQCYVYAELKNIQTVLTIHNAQYQGWFSHDKVNMIPEFDFNNVGLLDWDGNINPLASAIKCAWKVTTVSPSYMEELKKSANGLESLLSYESAKCTGILNGIDWEVWNPETDAYLIENYNINTVVSGREFNKKWICSHYNLDFEKPLFAFIGRLVGEKGADLFPETFKKVLQENDNSIFLLGSGNDAVEAELIELKKDYVGSYNAFIGYDEKLAHIVYAGADFILMPSRVEPCGLNQMYALRYGSIPIVRSIGGLKDTVIDISEKGGFGICHNEVTVSEITEAIERGVKLFENQIKYNKIRKIIMGINHSWDASALAYINLYKSLNQ